MREAERSSPVGPGAVAGPARETRQDCRQRSDGGEHAKQGGVTSGVVSDETAETLARMFTALGDPTRVKLLSMMGAAPGW